MDRHTHTLTHATCPCAITDRLTATDTRFTQSRERQLSQLTNKGNLLFSQHKGQPPANGKLLLLLRRSQTRGRFALATAHALGVPTPQQVDNHRHYLKLYSIRPEGPRPPQQPKPITMALAAEDESCATLPGLDSGCLPSLASPGVHARAVACEERNEISSDCLFGDELQVSKDDNVRQGTIC